MTFLTLTLHGDPISKGRPRLSPSGHAYTPERTRAGERAISAIAQGAMDGQPATLKPVGIACEFYCATVRKTDGDNLLKLVTDAFNQIVYADDSQILEYSARIVRGVGKASARTEVRVYLLED
jgi:Holliday junction resolvase RusA-like endonuclease